MPVHVMCHGCGGTVLVEPPARLPPWCGRCGADLRGVADIAGPAGRAPDRPSGEVKGGLSAEEWRDRFGWHNVAVGLLLAVWGILHPAGPPQSGGDKVLASHTRLNAVLGVVEVVTLVNGVALVLSGIALRRGWRWGYPLAIACGLVMVLAGGVFFAGFQHLAGGPYLEHGVARLTFVRANLDMLVGAVDGLGLLWFVSTRAARCSSGGR